MNRHLKHQILRRFHPKQYPANGEMAATADRQELRQSLHQSQNQSL